LFFSLAGGHEEVLECVQCQVTTEINESLLTPFTSEEVCCALDSIGDLKAPGPDGSPSIFYKRFWQLVRQQIEGGSSSCSKWCSYEWIDTVIVLIPKIKVPEKLKDLTPISLYNILYKLISKVPANLLKHVLPEIISPSQSAFVPGCMTNNVLLAYELIHYLNLEGTRRGRSYQIGHE
jgi:hypothetical protein